MTDEELLTKAKEYRTFKLCNDFESGLAKELKRRSLVNTAFPKNKLIARAAMGIEDLGKALGVDRTTASNINSAALDAAKAKLAERGITKVSDLL